MERIKGTIDTPIVERVSKDYFVRWDFQTDENGEVTFQEVKFPYKPTLEIIKEIILEVENIKIASKILEGFEWNGMKVWLSSENQFNYKAAFDLAMQTDGATLPVTFKFGTTEAPVYHEFTTVAELTDFYTAAMAHVNTVLKAGWMEKDNFDWSPYGGQSMLDTITEECSEEAILDQAESTDNA